jgi:hypothetical protein
MQIKTTPEYLTSQGLSETFPQRFFSKIIKENDCWIWTGATMKNGYGKLSGSGHGGENLIAAHRASWILHKGPIPEGLDVCHQCDTPECVNPEHLFIGTRLDNMKDCVSKGRSCRGEKHGNAKLTWSAVSAMKEQRADGRTYEKIAKSFGVTRVTAYRAITGICW